MVKHCNAYTLSLTLPLISRQMSIHFHTVTSPDAQSQQSHQQPRARVLAIGNMDGVHLGHQALVKTARALADAAGHRCGLLPFAPHPREYFNPALRPLTLMRPASKIKALRKLGVDDVIFTRFDHKFAAMEAEDFILKFCVEKLGAHHIVTGDNFYFGRNRKGNVALLEKTMRELKLGYSCVEPVLCENDETISSSRIRQVLSGGNVLAAAELLGRPFNLEGRIGHGDKRGREIGFPTANMPLHNLYLPAFGVYAVRTVIDGTAYKGVANLGVRPTFDGERPRLEVHLFEFDGNLYGKRLSVDLCDYIRPEQAFDGVEMLVDQIKQDVVKAKELLAANC